MPKAANKRSTEGTKQTSNCFTPRKEKITISLSESELYISERKLSCKIKIKLDTTDLDKLARTYLTKLDPIKTKKLARNYYKNNPNTYPYLPIPDMDTSTSAPPKKSIRASLTEQYEDRVASTLEKVDPNRAKAKEALKDEDFEVEALAGEWDGYKEPLPTEQTSYEDAPVLTLRELMPGATGGDEEEKDLDQSFRSNRIEFMVVQRNLTPPEKEADSVLLDPADVDWSIPDQEEYEDIMGTALDIYTDERPELVHALAWSSVGSTTGVGCFSVRTGRLKDLEDIRGTLRVIVIHGKCFESFPKRSLMKSYSLTAFFPRSTKCVGTKKLVTWLLSCNRGLQGKIWPIEARKYRDDHPVTRRRGARVLSFTGDQVFLDSLQRFRGTFRLIYGLQTYT